MKIYKLSIDYFTYDGYDGFVVVAKSRSDAIHFVIQNKPRGDEGIDIRKKSKVEFIGYTNRKKREFILSSFNAG